MGHYQSNVRDLEFNLFEVLRVQDRLGKGVLAEADEDTVRGVLDRERGRGRDPDRVTRGEVGVGFGLGPQGAVPAREVLETVA